MNEYTNDYLLDKQVRILQPVNGYRTSSDAVLLSSLINGIKESENILDVGSGTGGISLCLAHRFPENQICGLEIQPRLADLANQSAAANGFGNLEYFNVDINGKKLPLPPCSFSHVITNPPYSDHDMPSPNKSKALAHNHSATDLSQWLSFCLKMLKPFGHLYIVNRVEALNEIITALYKKAGKIEVIPVYSKPGQNAKRILIKAQKDSKSPTIILPPLYVHKSNGEYTPEANQILRQGKSFFAIDI